MLSLCVIFLCFFDLPDKKGDTQVVIRASDIDGTTTPEITNVTTKKAKQSA